MLDIKFVRDNPDAVKENIKKKFQDAKLPLVDEVIEKDAKYRECLKEVESLKAARNKLSILTNNRVLNNNVLTYFYSWHNHRISNFRATLYINICR